MVQKFQETYLEAFFNGTFIIGILWLKVTCAFIFKPTTGQRFFKGLVSSSFKKRNLTVKMKTLWFCIMYQYKRSYYFRKKVNQNNQLIPLKTSSCLLLKKIIYKITARFYFILLCIVKWPFPQTPGKKTIVGPVSWSL